MRQTLDQDSEQPRLGSPEEPTAYDRVAYSSYPHEETYPDRLCVVAALHGMSPADASNCRVLELGCGSGTPESARLARQFRLTGVDISPRQVERSRAAVPDAEFLCADFTDLELDAGSFDAVVSFYAFNHVPRELLAPLLVDVHAWLVPGGWLMAAFGQSDNAGWTGEWLGAETFFASFPPEVNSQLVRDAGFAIERDEVVEFLEPDPDGPARFQWVLACA